MRPAALGTCAVMPAVQRPLATVHWRYGIVSPLACSMVKGHHLEASTPLPVRYFQSGMTVQHMKRL